MNHKNYSGKDQDIAQQMTKITNKWLLRIVWILLVIISLFIVWMVSDPSTTMWDLLGRGVR